MLYFTKYLFIIIIDKVDILLYFVEIILKELKD